MRTRSSLLRGRLSGVRRRGPALFIATLAIALAFAGRAHAQVQEAIDRFASQITADVAADGVGGITAAVFRGDHVLWAQGFGWADRENRVPAGVRTVYRTGSISKSMTAVLMADLAEDGVLAFDDEVVDVLPEVAGFAEPPPGMSPITFRQLASHTAGLIREPRLEGAAAGPIDAWGEKVLASIPHTSFYTMPGTQYQYSNIGYGILGYALQRAAGEPFMQMMQERIFDPLGMVSSTFVIGPDLARRLAVGYGGEGHGTRTPAIEHNGRGYKVPNGGVHSTVADLATFAAAVMGRTEFELLRDDTRAEVVRRQTPEDGTGYGLGFFLTEVELVDGQTVTFVGHSGGVSGYNAYLVFDPETGYGVALMRNYNVGETNLGRAGNALLRDLLAETG
ncbi:MAG: serine hydrolase domain-containing protein [Gemmatimonadota bacterium]